MSTMTFGKYRGTPIRDLDDGYLTWLSERELREPLRAAVRAELARRQAGEARPAPAPAFAPMLETAPPTPAPAPHIAEQIIAAGLEAVTPRVALVRLPEVRAAAEWLRERVREIR